MAKDVAEANQYGSHRKEESWVRENRFAFHLEFAWRFCVGLEDFWILKRRIWRFVFWVPSHGVKGQAKYLHVFKHRPKSLMALICFVCSLMLCLLSNSTCPISGLETRLLSKFKICFTWSIFNFFYKEHLMAIFWDTFILWFWKCFIYKLSPAAASSANTWAGEDWICY